MSDKMRNLLIDLAGEFQKRLNAKPVCMFEFLAECQAGNASPDIIAFAEAYNALWDATEELERNDPRFCMTEISLAIHYDRQLDAEAMLAKHGGRQGSHPFFSRGKWAEEVNNQNTDLGYWDWVREMVMIVDLQREDGR